MEEETGNHDKAEKIAEIAEHMVALFGLWDYGKIAPYLLIVGYLIGTALFAYEKYNA